MIALGCLLASAVAPSWLGLAVLGLSLLAMATTVARGRRLSWVLAAFSLFTTFALATGRLQNSEREYRSAVFAFHGKRRCSIEGWVSASPVLRSANESQGAATTLRVKHIACDAQLRWVPTLIDVTGISPDWARGERVEVVGDFAPIHRFLVQGADRARYLLGEGRSIVRGHALAYESLGPSERVVRWIDRARTHVRRRILATFPPESEALARALMLGETGISSEDADAFRVSGLSHLLAVSGTHLAIAVLSLVSFVRRAITMLPWSRAQTHAPRIAAIVGTALAWLYADFTGCSGSAVRAAAVLTGVLLAKALSRQGDLRRILGLSIIVATAVDPLVSHDLSFMLSLGATSGLVWIGPRLELLCGFIPKPLRGPLFTTWAASLGSAPVLLISAQGISIWGTAANLVAAPLGELFALPFCLLHGISSALPPLEQWSASIGSGALLAVRLVARAVSALPTVSLSIPPPSLGQGLSIAVGVLAMLARPKSWPTALAVVATVCVFSECALRRESRGILRATFLDVAQGDAAFIELPDGKTMLVDTGGLPSTRTDVGQRVLLPFLESKRLRRLDIVVLTHPHPDHYGGFRALLPRIEVGELWITHGRPSEGEYQDLIQQAEARGISIRQPSNLCANPRTSDGALVQVIGPCEQAAAEWTGNNASLVLEIQYGEHRVLLTGDAEAPAERQLAAGAVQRATLMKVGHHGSATSTTEGLLERVRPRDAVVSCGSQNTFGHPVESVESRLVQAGVREWRTDLYGSIVWQTDGIYSQVAAPYSADAPPVPTISEMAR